MSRAGRVGLAVLALSLVAAGAGAEGDPRAVELLGFDCGNRAAWSRLTLFANGTLRWKTGDDEGEQMRLAELDRGELAAYLARLEGEDLDEVRTGRPEVTGDWVELCALVLELPGRQRREFRFGRLDTLPLPLSRVVQVVADLQTEVERRAPRSRLPHDYAPRPGDQLVRFDGERFRIVALTSDKRGVELIGVEQPLVIYVPIDSLRELFESLAAP